MQKKYRETFERTDVEGTRNPGMYFTMTTWLMLLSVLSQSMSVSADRRLTISKCCQPGMVYGGQSTVVCVPAIPGSEELYSLDHGRTGFLGCKNLEDVTATVLDKLDPTTRLGPTACIEIFYDNSTRKSVPTVLHCQSSEDSVDHGKETVPLPNLIDMRRCCPKDNLYDLRWKSCIPVAQVVPDTNYSSADRLLDFLAQQLGSDDYLKIKTSGLNCTEVTYDYLLEKDALSVKQGQLHATLLDEWKIKKIVPLTSENACLSVTTSWPERIVARVCENLEFCLKNRCVRKCCPSNEGLFSDMPPDDCGPHDSPSRTIDFYEEIANMTGWNLANGDGYGVIHGKACQSLFVPGLPEWQITPAGHIELNSEVYNHSEHCMDINYNYTEYNQTIIPLLCPRYQTTDDEESFNINIPMQIISCVLLLITFLVYACLPALHNLHGKTLMCHVGSLWLAFTCRASLLWLDAELLYLSLGYITVFAFLAAFCWLNVMCFDIWWTFRGLRVDNIRGTSHKKKFLLYCAYSWLTPLALTIAKLITDMIELPSDRYAEGIKSVISWFPRGQRRYGELIFFFAPTTIQLLVNIVLFILTLLHCNKVKAEIRKLIVDRSDPKTKLFQANRTRLLTNLKLFFMMGIPWIIQAIMGYITLLPCIHLFVAFFRATDVINFLQSLLIFIGFVMKKPVYKVLRKRLGFGDKKKGGNPRAIMQERFRAKETASNATQTSTFTNSGPP